MLETSQARQSGSKCEEQLRNETATCNHGLCEYQLFITGSNTCDFQRFELWPVSHGATQGHAAGPIKFDRLKDQIEWHCCQMHTVQVEIRQVDQGAEALAEFLGCVECQSGVGACTHSSVT